MKVIKEKKCVTQRCPSDKELSRTALILTQRSPRPSTQRSPRHLTQRSPRHSTLFSLTMRVIILYVDNNESIL